MATKTVEERRAQLSSYWDRGPGPGGIMLPPTVGYINHDKTRKQNPAYSLGLQLPSTLIQKGNGPGPIYAIAKGLTAKGPDSAPSFSIRGQTKVIENFNTETPGPAAYLPLINVNRRRPPEFSMSWRTPVNEKGRFSPGPIYLLPPALGPKVPDKPAAAEVTLKSRAKGEDEIFRSPGPIYDIVSPNVYKPKGGEVTMKSRWPAPKSQSINAGPGSYNVHAATHRVWRNPPSFSLGIRHSEFAGRFMTECDKNLDIGSTVSANPCDASC